MNIPKIDPRLYPIIAVIIAIMLVLWYLSCIPPCPIFKTTEIKTEGGGGRVREALGIRNKFARGLQSHWDTPPRKELSGV